MTLSRKVSPLPGTPLCSVVDQTVLSVCQNVACVGSMHVDAVDAQLAAGRGCDAMSAERDRMLGEAGREEGGAPRVSWWRRNLACTALAAVALVLFGLMIMNSLSTDYRVRCCRPQCHADHACAKLK